MQVEDGDTFYGLSTQRRRFGAAAASTLLALVLAGLSVLAWQGIAQEDAARVRGPGSHPAAQRPPPRPVFLTPAPTPAGSALAPSAVSVSTLLVYIVGSADEGEFIRGLMVQVPKTEVRIVVAADPSDDPAVWRYVQAEAEAEAQALPGLPTATTVFDLRTR